MLTLFVNWFFFTWFALWSHFEVYVIPWLAQVETKGTRLFYLMSVLAIDEKFLVTEIGD